MKALDTSAMNCGPLSDCMMDGVPCLANHVLRILRTVASAVISCALQGTASAYLVK